MPSPLVSIGLPVYNGERFLETTLASLLTQTLADFELIISDNASTDRTADICRDLAARDARIRYIRQPHNIGAPANWNLVARQARGTFLKWASDSDICVPRLLEACVGPMLADPSIVLCYGRTAYIDENDRPVDMPDNHVESLEESPSERFRNVCLNLCLNSEQYGVIRREPLMRTRLDRPYPHGDLVLMAELALLGKFKLLPETLLHRRAAAGHWTGMMTPQQLNELFWPGEKPPTTALFMRRQADYLWSALTSPVSPGEKLRAAGFALRLAYWRKANIGRELMGALRHGEGVPGGKGN